MIYPDALDSGGAASGEVAMTFPAPAAVAFGAVSDDGNTVVAAWTAADGVGTLSIYRVVAGTDHTSPIAAVSVADTAAAGTPAEVYFGDVDPAHAGEEIVVAQLNHPSGRLRLQVFAGLSEGRLYRIARRTLFRARPAAGHRLAVAVAEVWPESPGREIVATSPQGRTYVLSLGSARQRVLTSISPFADRRGASSARFAIGDFVRQRPGNEIAFADDGTAGDGLVRVIDPRDGSVLVEFQAFPAVAAAGGLELWAADLGDAQSGDGLLIGQGAEGGQLRVFEFGGTTPRLVATLPDPFARERVMPGSLVVADLLASHPGQEIAVAQAGAAGHLEILGIEANAAPLWMTADAGDAAEVAALIAAD